MLTSQNEPKDLPDWVELDYFERRRRLSSVRRLVARGSLVLSLLLGAGLIAGCFLRLEPVAPVYETRPVSTAHARLNSDCAQCHTTAFRTLGRLVYGDEHRSVMDATCKGCHDGPDHYQDQKDEDKPACATCHREHLDRPQLARVVDSHCRRCHDVRPSKSNALVTAFPAGHPEFAAPPQRSTLKFNHAKHLQEMPKLKPWQERKPADAVETFALRCANCHQPDVTGRFMKPIHYETHCGRCHTLQIQVTLPGDAPEAAQQAFRDVTAPHRTAAEIRATLRQRYTEFAQAQFKGQVPPLVKTADGPLPGPRPRIPPSLSPRLEDWVVGELKAAERKLFERTAGCGKCHQPTPDATRDKLPTYELSAVPPRWWQHARFDHLAHRDQRCETCHAGAEKSPSNKDVMLPKKDLCASCHSSAGGARHDCAECHVYHDPHAPRLPVPPK